MKVLNPNDTNHSISLIPRYYPNFDVVFTLTNETTKEKTVVPATYMIVDGLMAINFDYTFTNKSKYQLKIEENSIVYRGKLLITDQESQSYTSTKNLYYYE